MTGRAEPAATAADTASRARGTSKRVVQAVISLAIVVGIFAFAIPRIADYSAVADTLRGLSRVEMFTLVVATLANLITYWLQNMSALPGLGFWQAAVVTQTTTSVANTLPAGGAVAVGLTYSMLRSWGFDGKDVALYVGVTGIWNVFMKLGLPILALGTLAIAGQATGPLIVASSIGLGVLAIAIASFVLVLWRSAFARRIGDRLGAIVSWVRGRLNKPGVTTWGAQAVEFRARTVAFLGVRWIPLTLTTVVSHLALWIVLLLCLRLVGVSEAEVSTLQVLAVFAFGRLIGALPVTPGGLGVIELGYIGGLATAGGNEAEVVSAVLLFRVLTYGVQIPLGGFTYLVWRARSSWRRAAATAERGEPVRTG